MMSSIKERNTSKEGIKLESHHKNVCVAPLLIQPMTLTGRGRGVVGGNY